MAAGFPSARALLSKSYALLTFIAIRSLTSSAESPDTRITFLRLLWPEAMVTEERGTFKSFAKKFDASFVRLAIDWRRGEGNFQCVAQFTSDCVLSGIGMDLN